MKKFYSFLGVLTLSGVIFFSSCSKLEETQPSDIQQKNETITPSNLRLKCQTIGSVDFDSAKAYLDFIQLKEVNTGNLVTIWNTGEWFDLLHMETGILGDIAFLQIPAGEYFLAICHVTHGYAYKNGVQTYIKFPAQKMVMNFSPAVPVGEHLSAEFSIIIDISNSFVLANNQYIFQPVVQVVNTTTDGRFVGVVYSSLGVPIIGANISLTNASNSFQTVSFPPDVAFDNLMFQITDIPAGTYTATASATGYQTATATVNILEGNYNSQVFILQ